MKFPRNAKIFRGQLDAAPLAGVFFLLCIFLLLNSSLVFTPGVRLDLPAVHGAPLPGVANPSVMVALDVAGLLYYENQLVQERELRARLRLATAKTTNLTLIVQADKGVKLDYFYQLSKLASEVGIQQVLVAARPAIRMGLAPAGHEP